VTFTWLLVYKNYDSKERAEAVRKYLRWCLTEGQSHNETFGFIRLSPKVVKAGLAAVDKVQP
jgi:phosphate transport system substrate-binding protein